MAIDINIGSKLDSKGFKQAETATDKLTKGVKNLAGTFGLAFGTTAVLNYAKASIKAAADDQKAQQQLSLALKNVGLERDAASSEEYIQRLQSEFGILDDLLRPAYQKLAVATKDTAESQKLMNLALDISASTGKDLNSVTTSLSRAYLGNNTALSRLGVGLSKADLKTKSFDEITAQLAETFNGSATAATKTFSGQLALLSTAAADASETIGTGLIESLKILGEDGSISNLVTDMDNFATSVSDASVGIALLIKEIKNIPLLGMALQTVTRVLGAPLEIVSSGGKAKRERENYNKNEHMARMPILAVEKQLDELDKEKLDRQRKILSAKNKELLAARKLTAEKKKQEVLDQASLILAQGQKLFDEEGIQLAAASLGTLSDEDRLRLAIKTDIYNLEQAINEGNVEAAAALSQSLVNNAEKLGQIRFQMEGLSTVNNPFAAWLESLRQMSALLASLATPLLGAATPSNPLYQYGRDLTAEEQAYLDSLSSTTSPMGPGGGVFDYNLTPSNPLYGYNSMSQQDVGNTIVINVAGSVTTERDLVAAVTQGLYNNQASGTPINYSTVY